VGGKTTVNASASFVSVTTQSRWLDRAESPDMAGSTAALAAS
jgi:hypothetical protein